MITPAHVQLMARYNRWQNENLYSAAEPLPPAERLRNAGAFFGSIQDTLAHILWADQHWMRRFDPASPLPRAKSGAENAKAYPEWADLKRDRVAFDDAIIAWAGKLDPAWLASDLTYYSGIAKRDLSKPKWMLLTHYFNHQTHHRGQVHCLLTQAGVKPGDTDLPFMA